jgi:hypothetical protein
MVSLMFFLRSTDGRSLWGRPSSFNSSRMVRCRIPFRKLIPVIELLEGPRMNDVLSSIGLRRELCDCSLCRYMSSCLSSSKSFGALCFCENRVEFVRACPMSFTCVPFNSRLIMESLRTKPFPISTMGLFFPRAMLKMIGPLPSLYICMSIVRKFFKFVLCSSGTRPPT